MGITVVEQRQIFTSVPGDARWCKGGLSVHLSLQTVLLQPLKENNMKMHLQLRSSVLDIWKIPTT